MSKRKSVLLFNNHSRHLNFYKINSLFVDYYLKLPWFLANITN